MNFWISLGVILGFMSLGWFGTKLYTNYLNRKKLEAQKKP